MAACPSGFGFIALTKVDAVPIIATVGKQDFMPALPEFGPYRDAGAALEGRGSGSSGSAQRRDLINPK